jgi:nucleoside-diphosphate-sugar epimerase
MSLKTLLPANRLPRQVAERAVLNPFWLEKRILVTGGAGFIGSHLVERLSAGGARLVRVADNLERGRIDYIKESMGRANVDFRHVDLRDGAEARTACAGIDVVFHLASKVGGILYYVERPGEVFRDNTLIDQNVWSASISRQVPYYLYASSAHIYPIGLQSRPDAPPIVENQAYPADPELSYGWAKLLGEKLIQYSVAQGCTTRATIPRLIGSYGPNQDLDVATGSAIPVFCRRAIEYPTRGPFIVLGTGAETRSFHYVSDTIDAILLAVEALVTQPEMPPFNLGGEGRVTIREIAETIISISGKLIEIQWDSTHPTVVWGQSFNCRLARELLAGWTPKVSLRDGLEQCYRHIESRLARSG